MASAQTGQCPHGFPAAECMICRTLGPARAVRPDAVIAPAGQTQPERRSRRVGLSAFGVLVLVVLALFGVWFVWHLVWAVIHIVELIAVGVACGWVGWKLGVGHGRRIERRGR